MQTAFGSFKSGSVAPITIPNSTLEGDGFYVSFNDYDTSIYGGDTTALVFGQMEKFFILNGDHLGAYSALIGDGFDVCFEYFTTHVAAINKYSEKLPETKDADAIEDAIWYQIDSRHLYAKVANYLERPSDWWLAVKVQESAANSAARAREALSIQ